MAGLSAIVSFDGAPADGEVLARMNRAAAHRGNAVASHCAGASAFTVLEHGAVHARRLVENREGPPLRLALIGHLYSRAELAAALGRDVDSDAELVLAAYRRWGDDCLARLDGDFACIIHDEQSRRVLCARDALGMHPLCYAFDGKRLLVASEPRQIIAAGVDAIPSEEAIAAYMATTRHLYGGAQTFYRDVKRVEPGHHVAVNPGGARARRYWQLDPTARIAERTDADMAARVRELLVDAVERRVPERGPFACALSGGFDSATVAALYMPAIRERHGEAPLETFSFELRDLESDEPDLIDAVSDDLGTNHHHIYLDRDNVFAVLPEMLAACDEPTFDMGLLYLWRKKEAAARIGVRVMLSGLGGDELFVGQYHFLADLLRHLRLRELRAELAGIYPLDRYTLRPTTLRWVLQAYVLGPLIPRGIKRLGRRLALGERSVPPWIDADLARRTALVERIKAGPEQLYRDAYRQDCYEVFKSSLLDVTLPIHESLGAAFGMETRFPLLDRRLVEYLFAAPREQKIHRGEVRGIQRRAMHGMLPEAVLTRHIKKNINPVLRRQQYQNFVTATRSLLAANELRCTRYLDADFLRRTGRDFLEHGGDASAPLVLWYAMNLEHWLQRVAQ
ncbi:MAG: asparagine synthase-related protein [Gammaproteobacteria bacterium]